MPSLTAHLLAEPTGAGYRGDGRRDHPEEDARPLLARRSSKSLAERSRRALQDSSEIQRDPSAATREKWLLDDPRRMGDQITGLRRLLVAQRTCGGPLFPMGDAAGAAGGAPVVLRRRRCPGKRSAQLPGLAPAAGVQGAQRGVRELKQTIASSQSFFFRDLSPLVARQKASLEASREDSESKGFVQMFMEARELWKECGGSDHSGRLGGMEEWHSGISGLKDMMQAVKSTRSDRSV